MLAVGCRADTFVADDGGTGDGSSDAATDVPLDVASCTPTWCVANSQANEVCADFDESNLPPSDWSSEITVGSVDVTASPAEQCQSLHAHLAQGGPVRGKFTHMVLDVTYSGSSTSASLQYQRADNNNNDAVQANAAAINLSTSLSFIVGLAASTQTQNALDAYYDDVVATLQ